MRCILHVQLCRIQTTGLKVDVKGPSHTRTGPATSIAHKPQSVHNQNPLIANLWFPQCLLHKCLIDPFEYGWIMKQKKKKGWGILFGANSPHANSSCLL